MPARLCIKVSIFKENKTLKTSSLTFYEIVDV